MCLKDLLADLGKVCGQSFDDDETRIFFGKGVRDHQYPWMAALVFVEPKKNFEFVGCGGAIISNNVIMTAAHCVQSREHTLKKIRAGHAHLNLTSDYEIETVKIHPNFGRSRLGILVFDIALVKLAKPLKFDILVRPICLPRQNYSDEDLKYLTVAGWGATENEVRGLFIPNRTTSQK